MSSNPYLTTKCVKYYYLTVFRKDVLNISRMSRKKFSFRFKEIRRSQDTGKYFRDIFKGRYYKRLDFYYFRSDDKSRKEYFSMPF